MRVWDVRSAQSVRVLGCVSSAECVEFSRDGRLVAASDAAGHISIFDLPSGRLVGTRSAGGSEAQITALSFSHNGSLSAFQVPYSRAIFLVLNIVHDHTTVLNSHDGYGDIALAVATTLSSRALQVFDISEFYESTGEGARGTGLLLRTRSTPLLCAAFTHKNLLCTAGTLR